MLSIIVNSFFKFSSKKCYHIFFSYEKCMISIFRVKTKDFSNYSKLIIDRVEWAYYEVWYIRSFFKC